MTIDKRILWLKLHDLITNQYQQPDKSLFHSAPGCGLSIGNLTSQIFANVYLNALDLFVKHDMGMRYYGCYVDDFVLVHPDHEYLKALIPRIADFLQSTLKLTLHPRKVYLQHYSKGVHCEQHI